MEIEASLQFRRHSFTHWNCMGYFMMDGCGFWSLKTLGTIHCHYKVGRSQDYIMLLCVHLKEKKVFLLESLCTFGPNYSFSAASNGSAWSQPRNKAESTKCKFWLSEDHMSRNWTSNLCSRPGSCLANDGSRILRMIKRSTVMHLMLQN